MAEVIKLVGFEVTLNATANLVANAVLVKISNANSTTASVITVVNSSGANTANTTLLPLTEIYLQKPTDSKLISSLTSLVTATPIAFS